MDFNNRNKQLVRFKISDTVMGFTINLNTTKFTQKHIFDHIASGQIPEQETILFLARVLEPGDVFIDIGAHIGFYSLFAATVTGPSGRVISCEPEPNNFADLIRNKEENGFKHIEAHNAAVSDKVGVLPLWVNQDNDGGHALWNVGTHPFNSKSSETSEVIDINTLSIDTLISQSGIDRVKVIKIDAEGAERMILDGAKDAFLNGAIDFIICEINEFALSKMSSSQNDIRRRMMSFGYHSFVLPPNGLPKLIPENTTVASKRNTVFNVLFSRIEELSKFFPMEVVP